MSIIVSKAPLSTADELLKLQGRLLDELMTSLPDDPDIWHKCRNWLDNTNMTALCPVAIAMIDHTNHWSVASFSLEYLAKCAGPAKTCNDLLLGEMLKPRFLTARLFLYWKNAEIAHLSDAQIKELVASENAWVRALTTATFPDQFDKNKKDAAAKDISHLVSNVPDADFLKLVESLDSQTFAIREQASKKLIASGDRYEGMILGIKKTGKSAEVLDRLDRALREITERILPADVRYSLATLGQLGTPEADELLKVVADGPAGLRATKFAEGILEKKKQNRRMGGESPRNH